MQGRKKWVKYQTVNYIGYFNPTILIITLSVNFIKASDRNKEHQIGLKNQDHTKMFFCHLVTNKLTERRYYANTHQKKAGIAFLINNHLNQTSE